MITADWKTNGTAARPAVLLVDDNPGMLAWCARLCAREFRVVTASDIEVAVAILESTTIDLVVTDYKTSSRNGPCLLSLCRNRYPWIHRVLISGAFVERFDEYVASGVAERFCHKSELHKVLVSGLKELIGVPPTRLRRSRGRAER